MFDRAMTAGLRLYPVTGTLFTREVSGGGGLAVGLLELPAGLRDESIYPGVLRQVGGSYEMGLVCDFDRPPRDIRGGTRGDVIEGVLRSAQWSAPPIPGGVEVFIRRTEVPASSGRAWFVVGIALQEASAFGVSGDGFIDFDLGVQSASPDRSGVITYGSQPSQVLSAPCLMVNDDLIGLLSTLDVASQRLIGRHTELWVRDELTADEQAELADIEAKDRDAKCLLVCRHGHGADDFRRYLRAIFSSGMDVKTWCSTWIPMTAQQLLARDAVCVRALEVCEGV